MELKFFLYNELIQRDKLDGIMRGHGVVTNITPSLIKNCRLFDYRHKYPVVFPEEDLYRKSRIYTYGALITIECNIIALNCIDGFMGCSKSIFHENLESDLYIRESIEVYPLDIKSVDDFLNMNYEVRSPEKAFVYFGNRKNTLFSKVYKHRHKRAGFFYKDFLSLFNTGIDIQI